MTFDELLITLGLDTRLDLAEACKIGSCSIQFDGNVRVDIEHDQNTGILQAYCRVCDLPSSHREAFFAMLLQAHMFGTATDGCTFGLDPEQRQVILFKTIPLSQLNSSAAIQQLELLVQQSLRWGAYLPTMVLSWANTVTENAVNIAATTALHS